MHDLRIVSLHKVRRITASLEESNQIFVALTRHYRRPGNFVSVQMQDRQYRSISRRIQEVNALPAAFEWAGFGFAVANDASHDKVLIIESRSESVNQRISESSALVH